MSDRLQEIKDRWANVTEPECEDWWYQSVRHIQRNVDMDCGYEAADIYDEDEHYSNKHPSRYDGRKYAHAGADIAYLLAALGVDDE